MSYRKKLKVCQIALTCVFLLQACSDREKKKEYLTEEEVNHLATAQYYEIQKTYVDQCSKHGVNYSGLFERFKNKYNDFFSESLNESKNILQSIGMKYEDFRENTVKATLKSADESFCKSTRGDALRNRIENPKVIERGINAHFMSLKRSFKEMGVYKKKVK